MLQILPEGARSVVVEKGVDTNGGHPISVVTASVVGGVVGGLFLVLITTVAIATAKRRRDHL